jgi:large subunit ribosomal protein L24
VYKRQVDPKAGRVIVQGVNLVKKHKRETPNNQTRQNNAAGIVTVEAPIDASNVQLVVNVNGKEDLTRVVYVRETVTKRRPDG